MEFKIFRKIVEINRAEWEAVYPKAPEDYDFFRTLDDSPMEGFDYYYVMVYRQGGPAAAAAFFVHDYALDTTVQGWRREVLVRFKKIFPGLLNIRALMCGIPMGQGRVGLKEPAAEALACLLEAAEAIAHRRKVALLIVKDFEQASRQFLAPLEGQGFYRLEGLPLTEMSLDFKTFDDYLAKLSYASRYDLRRKFRKIDGKVDIRFEAVDSLSGPLLEEAYALYLQAVGAHQLGFETMPPEFFENIGKNMPGRAKFFLWRIKGKLAGFAFCLTEGSLFVDYYVGFDYKVALEHHLFFVRFRDLLNWCLSNGMTRYEMGYTSYEVKRRLGFGLLPMDIYVKHRGRIANRLVGFFAKRLHFDRFDPALRQFKEKWHDKK